MKKSTQIIDLSNVINPRVGDDDLLLPLHIVYGDNQTDMRGKDVEFLSEDPNKKNIYIAGTCNTNTPGDNLLMGNLTFRFPAGTFKADGTYDPDKTMFRIVDKETQKVISSVNVKITVMKSNIELDFDPDNSSYDSRLETMLHDFHDKGQTMLDEIKDLKNQANSNVSGDTATTAKEAKKQADQNAGDISDLKGEVAGARGRFANMAGREDAQDAAINQKESITNANANYTALQQKDAQQDAAIATKARQDFIVDYLSKMNLQPEAFENEAALQTKYPNGNPGIMVTEDTGHKWLYVNGAWKDCGVYQSAGFTADQLLTLTQGMRGQLFIYREGQFVAPYDDLNTLPANTIVTYVYEGARGSLANAPDKNELYTVITFGSDTRERRIGAYQIAVDHNGLTYHRFYWNNWSNWELTVQTINIFDKRQLLAPYDDLNTLPSSNVIYSAAFDQVNNRPNGLTDFFMVETQGNLSTKSQKLINLVNGDTYIRYIRMNTIGAWKKLASTDDIEAQQNGIDCRTPSLSLFTNFGVVGDSYASGTLAKDDGKTFVGGQDNLCWPIMMARKWGTTALRLAQPGLTTRDWLANDIGLKRLNESPAQDIYYLCLGINDHYQLGTNYLGSEADMDNGTDTFYGNYAKIIKAIQTKAPKAMMIMFGIANPSEEAVAFSNAQQKIADHFKIPFVSERDDPFFTSDYYTSNMKGGHPQAPGYAAMALAIERLVQKTIINNPGYFNRYGW